MIVDSSAIIAILFREPGYERLVEALEKEAVPGIGTPTLAETGIVLGSLLQRSATGKLSRFIQEFGLVEVPFGEAHWRAAADAYLRFGKGRHTAALNFGDCLTYAVAHLANEPLLFVGTDFTHTDLQPALLFP
jgi:ribonuclease VapC